MSRLIGDRPVNEIVARIIAIFAAVEAWIITLNYENGRELRKAKEIQQRIRNVQSIKSDDALHWAVCALPSHFSFSENAKEVVGSLLDDYKEHLLSQFLEIGFGSWSSLLVKAEEQYFFPLTFRNFLERECLRNQSITDSLSLDTHKLSLAYHIITQDIDSTPIALKALTEQIESSEIESSGDAFSD